MGGIEQQDGSTGTPGATSGDARALFEPGRTCWRIERADQFALIIDASEYFAVVREAMLKARKSIMLIGWDFDARIDLVGDSEGPKRLGDFILWLANRSPELEIRILRWDFGAIKSLFSTHSFYTVVRWKMHPRITFRLDSTHPMGSSHHQKIVVLDDNMAFCGGIDMTSKRWDTREHLDEHEERVTHAGKPVGPWHDATSAMTGPAAVALADLARDRWEAAGGKALPPVTGGADCWPERLKPLLRDVEIAIARTQPDMENRPEIVEIENLYLTLIASARRLIYAESQYFASRKIGRAIAERLLEPDGPEIIIINPDTAEGWLEPIAMDSARARLWEALHRIDRFDRLRIYHPRTEGGQPIYVHAKVMMVDDQYLRVGSSNFNNRSLRFDTECDIVMAADPARPEIAERISHVRDDLIAEHLGVSVDEVTRLYAEQGSMIAVIEQLMSEGRSLVPYEVPDLSTPLEWMADNEILDPEGPAAVFEPLHKRGLFRNWRLGRRRRTVTRRRLG